MSQPDQAASPPSAISGAAPRTRAGRLRPYLPQALVAVLGLSLFSNLALWWRVHELEEGPPVAVVGVREMTQGYLHRIATSEVTPEEAAIRTKAFLAVAQDEMSRMAPVRGRLVLAKECVLSGETRDLTTELQASVERKLSAATGGLSDHVGPIAPSAIKAGGQP